MDAYEDRVLGSTASQGVVLHYGFFYGPGTWYLPDGAVAEQVRKGEARIFGDGTAVWSFVHIDAAVAATVAALKEERRMVEVGKRGSGGLGMGGRGRNNKKKGKTKEH